MIRDPSDGSVREVVDEKPQISSTKVGKMNPDNGLMSSTTSGLRQPTKTKAQERLERSREWLKNYHATKETTHARGNDGEAGYSADGRSGNQAGKGQS